MKLAEGNYIRSFEEVLSAGASKASAEHTIEFETKLISVCVSVVFLV